MKKILIFSPLVLPIPAIGGGAVETLITGLINKNEIYHKADLVVISKFDSNNYHNSFKHTKMYFF